MRKKVHLKHLQDWDTKLTNLLRQESDRASVILSVSFLDSAIHDLLKMYLIPSNGKDDPMFEGVSAPLGTFSARIESAFRFGLIDGDFAQALHMVRKIRNTFAHNIFGCTFHDASVVSRMSELSKCMDADKADAEFRSIYPPGLRGDFEMAVSYMQWLIRDTANYMKPVNPQNATRCSYDD